MIYSRKKEEEWEAVAIDAISEERRMWENGEATPDSFFRQFIMNRMGWTEAQYEQFMTEWREAEEEAEKALEARIAEKVEKSRKAGIQKITPALVAKGLEFLLNTGEGTSREELVDGLLALGCNFTLEDIRAQFPGEGYLLDGIMAANVAAIASIIPNVRDSSYGRSYFYGDLIVDPKYAGPLRQFAERN